MLKELSDVDLLRIQKAEAEMAACENCAGECQKLCPDYCVPRIRSVMGNGINLSDTVIKTHRGNISAISQEEPVLPH